jgi:hypothetical protein
VVAEAARSVRIAEDRIEPYAAELPVREIRTGPSPVTTPEGLDPAETAWFVLVLDSINFGSGYFPHLRKVRETSGYRTIEGGLVEWWRRSGAPSVTTLRGAEPSLVAEVLGQSPSDPVAGELMGLFARAWRDLAGLVIERHGGDPSSLVSSAGGSPANLVGELLRMPLYRDFATYDGRVVPFLKRAQITVYDLSTSVPGPLGQFDGLEELTIFADNLIPHVLRLDGLLRFDPQLVERIERGDLIPPGSPEEVEIRACAVHAVEEILARLRRRGALASAAELDAWLWLRGGQPAYKAHPRHRTRTTFY